MRATRGMKRYEYLAGLGRFDRRGAGVGDLPAAQHGWMVDGGADDGRRMPRGNLLTPPKVGCSAQRNLWITPVSPSGNHQYFHDGMIVLVQQFDLNNLSWLSDIDIGKHRPLPEMLPEAADDGRGYQVGSCARPLWREFAQNALYQLGGWPGPRWTVSFPP